MTDKVQKILDEITVRKLCTMDEHMAFYNDKAKEDYRLLSEIEEFIKASQEEPKQKFKIGDRIKFKGVYDEDVVRTITDIQKYDDGSCRYIFADGSLHSVGNNEIIDDTLNLSNVQRTVKNWKEMPVSEDLEEYSALIADELPQGTALTSNGEFDIASVKKLIIEACKYGAKWQKEQIKELLLSEVLPYFMNGGEADEVVAKLEEVLNQNK